MGPRQVGPKLAALIYCIPLTFTWFQHNSYSAQCLNAPRPQPESPHPRRFLLLIGTRNCSKLHTAHPSRRTNWPDFHVNTPHSLKNTHNNNNNEFHQLCWFYQFDPVFQTCPIKFLDYQNFTYFDPLTQ